MVEVSSQSAKPDYLSLVNKGGSGLNISELVTSIVAAEIEPKGGTLLVFKRSDNSWHGHHSFEGKRRAIQLNWVTEASVVKREQSRHGFSSKIKKLFGR